MDESESENENKKERSKHVNGKNDVRLVYFLCVLHAVLSVCFGCEVLVQVCRLKNRNTGILVKYWHSDT